MKKQILKITGLALLLGASVQVNAQTTDFNTDLENWSVSYGTDGTVTHDDTEGLGVDQGALKLERSGDNANFGIKVGGGVTATGIDATTKKYIRIRYKNETNGTKIRIGGKNDEDIAIKDNSNGNIELTIGANSDEYVTSYLDMSSYTSWKGDLLNFYMLVRQNAPDTAGDAFYLDEIEFLETAPAETYSEFIKNPSFDGPSGVAHFSGTQAFANRTITSTESHDGDQSLRFVYTADATAPFWTFSNYEKVYGSKYSAGSTIQVKLWVKTNRATPISLSARVKLTDGGVETSTKPITALTTTNTAMEWEELTFDIATIDDFDGVTFWFALNYSDGAAENLLNGDVVYIDQMSASITSPTLSSSYSKIEGASVKAENGTISVSGANLDAVYSITGQQVKSSDLASGVYIVRISKGNKQDAIKVVL
ncbi:hypothetical protein AXE80_08095 [Wenyingzhuangia fucanilytica]|uniref:Secretion system C-terminal sorting domain-containing protein n=1 Tax=Wenyingzhuangia fucanilytica TaxID=1790137 RepID=A0A1B1Y626_9FLAO|nr:T9SS type A sorting domain-containing protein [Wenyingzhuangia fucanilytica]ANW96241.1 hypothetical protein AXE80_08095 [Wenyingzhuangia fucanilytica]